MAQRLRRPIVAGVGLPGIAAAVAALAAIFVVGVYTDSGWRLLHAQGLYTAHPARFEVLAFAAIATAIAAIALSAGRSARWSVVLGPAILVLLALGATATFGGQGVAMLAVVLSATAPWFVGRLLLRLIGSGPLAEQGVVAWLAGLGPLCLLTLLLGRMSLLKWWTIGALVVVLGVLGTLRAGEILWEGRARIASEINRTSLSAASAGVILLTIAVAAIYTAAPEVQTDALFGNAYLPMLWAKTGTIGPMTGHVQLSIGGWGQLIATWGNLLGAPATGRYLQLLGLMSAPAVVWSWARRFGSLGPLAAVAVATTPIIFWQATTADDDLLLALAVFALAVAVFEALQRHFPAPDRAVGIALGLMAGTCISLKYQLIPISMALLLGWIVSGRRLGTIFRRLVFGAAGTLITASPPLILHWSDTGNPIFPAYNNIFKSPYWLPINEKFNFPFFPNPGLLGPVKAIWDAFVNPAVMQDTAPPGSYAALAAVILAAAAVGWRYRRRVPGSFVLWCAIVLTVTAWWIEFRYLRYLLPAALTSIVLLLAVSGRLRLSRAFQRGAVVAVALTASASFAVAVAQLWNVPNRKVPFAAAIGRDPGYLESFFLERDAILAFNRLSPPRAQMVTDVFQRVWLTGGRDFDEIWELAALLQLHGPIPNTGDGIFARLRARGIDWALVSGPDRVISGDSWLPRVLRTHGQPRFSARGSDLYELVDHPSVPVPVGPCDRARTGIPACWPGPRAAALPLVRTVPACPGQLLAITASETAGGPSVPIQIQFPGGLTNEALAWGQTVPGATQPTYATVPPGSHGATITLLPPAATALTHVTVGRFGSRCGPTYS